MEVGFSSRKFRSICSTCSGVYQASHCSRIQGGMEYLTLKYSFVPSGGYCTLSRFLAMDLSTPLTNPLSPPNPLDTASFTASLQTAESGTLSIYLSW